MGEPKKKPAKKKVKGAGTRPWLITAASFLFVIAVGLWGWFQLNTYEKGVLDVYANQQDGYVQLVLEQIRLTEKRGGTESQIEEILATLDASSNRYWTLSRRESLIFVKDVMETNRYQGFTTATYYQTNSAKDFVSRLQMDRVTHETIQIDIHPYIASGAAFSFKGESYRVCLLTNAETVLDHNAYLTAKINLITLALIALVAFVISIHILSYVAGSYRKKYIAAANSNESLLRQMEKLNDALHRDELYDARHTAYTRRALPMIWEKLTGRDAWPLSFLVLRCRSQEEQQQFLQFTQLQMNRKVLRVFLDDGHILLILIRVEGLELEAVKENTAIPGVELTGELTLKEPPEGTLEQCFNSFWERTQEYEKQAPTQV